MTPQRVQAEPVLDSTTSPSHVALTAQAAPGSLSTAASEAQSPAVPTIELLTPESEPPAPARRLVVLVPDPDVDESELARRIWLLASPRMLKVVYVGMVQDHADESFVRQQLATLAALTRDNHTTVETQAHDDRDWLRIVRRVRQPGDQIICVAEQTTFGRGAERRSLGEALASALGAPVYLLSGLPSHARPQPPRRLPRLLIDWAVPVAIIVGFFLMQVAISQLVEEWARIALLCISVLAEAGLIGLWNQFAG